MRSLRCLEKVSFLSILVAFLSCATPRQWIKTPMNGPNYLTEGNIYYNKHDYNKAIDSYSKAINANPPQVDAYLNRGNIYFERKDYDGMRVVQARIANGYKLFGKYYQGLWD